MMARLSSAEKKRAERARKSAAGRRPVSLTLPEGLIDWLDTDAAALDQSRAERIEAILRERQQAVPHA